MTRSRTIARILVPAALFLLAVVPSLAQSATNLDPNNGGGTDYNFFVQGSAKPLDPSGGKGATGKLIGTMTIFQSVGDPEFTSDILIDTNGDGVAQGTMTCQGNSGLGRAAFTCQGLDEDGEDIFVLITTKAASKAGKVVLSAGKGLGFTVNSSLTFVFQGSQK